MLNRSGRWFDEAVQRCREVIGFLFGDVMSGLDRLAVQVVGPRVPDRARITVQISMLSRVDDSNCVGQPTVRLECLAASSCSLSILRPAR